MRLVLLLVFALLAGGVARGVDAAGKDLYKVLGIDRGADDRTVKKMYRKLALEHHPDKGGDKDKFAERMLASKAQFDAMRAASKADAAAESAAILARDACISASIR